ncbi:DUF1616 domain-containing protein [Methanolobus halotolerans]|uniref:DUF1616 domain-containing protein n=1 Tax=Methanolobus halotolerans TaxID=2052935 RepID=A0A4E0R2D4_9EURY|nr:DUF1616 domain-containing protein [Methanolobus halotolerans]TGC11553.1 hypothetical protein CUN85_01415 [Methanolobus halotolerans]
MSEPKKCLYTQDLMLLLLFSLLSVIFILVAPLNDTPLRILFALILIFFIPGYAFISALFPGNREISGIERFTLSVGFSIVIMVFDGFIISVTPWKFRPDSITISLSLLTILFVVLAYLSRRRLPQGEQFSFSFNGFIDSLTSEDVEPEIVEDSEDIKESDNKKFRATSRKKVSAKMAPGDRPPKKDKKERKSQRIPPEITRALMIAMVLSIIIASAMFAYAKVTREKETFTALYILGPDGKAENYPSVLSVSQPTDMIVGIENYELTDVNYILQIRLDGNTLKQMQISLEDKEKWEQEIAIKPIRFKQGRQKLEFAIYKEDVSPVPYRSVHLWVTQELSTEGLPETDIEIIDFIDIDNPSMESYNGWIFTSTNESHVTGSYTNDSGIHSTGAYVINSTYEGMTGGSGVDQHSISQEIQSDRTENVVLSAYLKDSYTAGTPGTDETQFKRVILNGEVVWSDGVNGDEGWQRLQVPVTVMEGTNTLTFTLMQNRNLVIHPVEMTVDEISFLPLSQLSPYINDDNTVESIPPTSRVLPLPPAVSEDKFTVSWNGTDAESGILYYDIDYSTDGTIWKRWLSRTVATSAQFEGKESITYYFRSRAVDNALNEETEHAVADTSTTVDRTGPQISLEISPNPTSETTYLTVESTKPLQDLTCLVTPRTFGSTENVRMTSKDNLVWTAKYTVKLKDTFDVEITGKDYANNTAYTFGTIYTDTSLEDLDIIIEPEKTANDVTIKIVPSIALQENPTVTVKDRYGRSLDVNFESSSDGEYSYTAEIDDDINDGVARVTVKAKTVDSENLYEEKTFIIDRIEPSVNSISPMKDETVDSPSIMASYSDDRSGIDRDRTVLRVNGIDVTADTEIGSGSLSYNAEGLASGRVDVYLSVTDQAGNTEKEEWSFYISS